MLICLGTSMSAGDQIRHYLHMWEWVMSHMGTSHVAHGNQTGHTWEWVMSSVQLAASSKLLKTFENLYLCACVREISDTITKQLLFNYCTITVLLL